MRYFMVSYSYEKKINDRKDRGLGTYYYSNEKIPSVSRLCNQLDCDVIIILYMYEFNNEKEFKEAQS